MRVPQALSSSVSLAVVLAVANLGSPGCSSSGTVVALTVTSGDGVVQVSTIRVTITPASGAAIMQDFTPPMKDSGAIATPFFQRLSLPSGADGPATLLAEAVDSSGAAYAGGRTDVRIEKNHAVAAQVMLTVGGPPPPPSDGGADAGGASDAGDARAVTDAGSGTGDTGG